jgi:hypothetical protein
VLREGKGHTEGSMNVVCRVASSSTT